MQGCFVSFWDEIGQMVVEKKLKIQKMWGQQKQDSLSQRDQCENVHSDNMSYKRPITSKEEDH